MNKLHYVYKPSVAHQLLQMGYVIKDVKPQKQEDGSIDLDIGIRLVPNDQLPEGSDAHAVRSGFISIGKVRDRVT